MEHLSLNQFTIAIEVLVALLQNLCGNVEELGLTGMDDLVNQKKFWNRLNAAWMDVLKSSHGIDPCDWKAVGEAVESCGNILELYGLVDYPLGFQEHKILERINQLS